MIAHGLLAGAVAVAGGNNALSAATSAITDEAAAPLLAHYLYGKEANTLKADEKTTISAITGLIGAGIGASTGNHTNIGQGAQSGQNAVGNNYLGTGVNLLGWQIGPDQMAEFAKEMAAACGVSPEACRQVEDKWYQLSLKQSGLNEEGVAEWNKKLDATFSNLYTQCQGDSACTLYLDLQKGLAKTTHLGMHGELAALGVSLKHAMDIKQGNWGALLLDGLNDFGAFIPAAATKPFEKGIEKIIAVGGEVFVKSKGVWTKTPQPLSWDSWHNYTKIQVGDREYAQVGRRMYSRHAVDRMQPSSLGSPAGSVGAGRSISPNTVEYVIRNGKPIESFVGGVKRTTYWAGDVGVVTEQNSRIVITVLRRGIK